MKKIVKVVVMGAAVAVSCVGEAKDLTNEADLTPLVMQSYGVRRAWSEDDVTVKVELGASQTQAREWVDSYRIVSRVDTNYAYEKFVRPKAVEAPFAKVEFTRPTGTKLPSAADLPLVSSVVTLKLPEPMKKGVKYAVIAQGSGSTLVTVGKCAGEFVHGEKTKEVFKGFAAQMVGMRRIGNVGGRMILCEMGPGYSPNNGLNLNAWNVTVNGAKVGVKAIGYRSKLECYLPTGWPFKGFVRSYVFLDLGKEVPEGAVVKVSCGKDVTAGARSCEMKFEAKKTLTQSIKANQVGYLPESIKVAYLGMWLGSMPEKNTADEMADELMGDSKATEESVADFYEMTLNENETAMSTLAPYAIGFEKEPKFEIVEEKSLKVVYKGQVKFIHNGKEWDGKANNSAENVYEIDFSAFKVPGRYFISVPGVGRSIAFDIDKGVYEKAAHVQAQGIYCQRCGCELDPKLTGGWKRIACHNKGIIPTTSKRYECGEFGPFDDTMEMVANPNLAKEEAARKKVLDDPKRVKLAFKDVADGFGKKAAYKVNVASGVTIAFSAKRSDEKAGGKWYGSVVLYGEDANGIGMKANWGGLKFGDDYIGRINDGRWHSYVVRMTPTGKGDEMNCELFMDGNRWSDKECIRRVNGMKGELSLGCATGEGAEGLEVRDEVIVERALNEKEMGILFHPVMKEVPRKLNIVGGHHDAGDYNPRSHIDVAQQLMNVYELKPQNFWDGQYNVPENEKANGIPDVIDEALWALRLWIGLQDKDGGVRHGTESRSDPNFLQTVELDDRGDFAWAKDAGATFECAGAFAQMSRILRKFPKYQKTAAGFLERAKKAYKWAVEHPTIIKEDTATTGEYNYSLRAYAAAHLFNTTGDEKYHKDFKQFTPWMKNPNAEIRVHKKYDVQLAAFAYMLIEKEKADGALWDTVLNSIRREADMYLEGSVRMAYKFVRHPYAPLTWGSGAYENYAVLTAWMWAKTGEQKYFDWMVRTCDNTLGANPLGLSWVTGLGERTIRCPLHNSRYRDTGFPVDGLQAQGPNQRGEGYSWVECAYPAFSGSFAPMYAFSDLHFAIVMDEPTMPNMVNAFFVFSLIMK